MRFTVAAHQYPTLTKLHPLSKKLYFYQIIRLVYLSKNECLLSKTEELVS